MEEAGQCCLTHSLLSAVCRFSDDIAVIHTRLGADFSITFRELWNCVYEISKQIKNHMNQGDGSTPKRIGILIPRSLQYIMAIFAVNKLSAAFVPLDPYWPLKRILASITDSGISLIIGCHPDSWIPESYQHHFTEVCRITSCPHLLITKTLQNSSASSLQIDEWSCSETTFSYIMYTSGSTGKPKGVCGTERGLLNRLNWMQQTYPYISSDVSCFKTEISFIDHVTEFLGPLLAGTRLIIPFVGDIKQNPLGLLNYLQVYKVTRLVAVPSLLRAFLPALEEYSLQLRLIVSSGEALSYELLSELHKHLPKATLLNLYGSTEVSGDCTYFDCTNPRQVFGQKNMPIGNAISGCSLHIFPEEQEIGELHIGGIGLAHGYWNDTERTSEKFIVSKELGIKLFRTGDVARRLVNGDIVLVGRTDRLVQIHGQRVEPEEIERQLEEYPQVQTAVVYTRCLNNDVQLAACIVLKGEVNENHYAIANMLKEWLSTKLPTYMVPEVYIFVKNIPLTDSGKLNYAAIQKLEVNPSSVTSNNIHEVESALKILQVFSKVLDTENISSSDDFFLLGGTSISAAHAAHLLGIDIRLIFKYRSALELHHAMNDQHDVHDLQETGTKKKTPESKFTVNLICSCSKEVSGEMKRKKRKTEAWPYGTWPCVPSAFVRSNQHMCGNSGNHFPKVSVFDSGGCRIQQTWKRCTHACLDATPLMLITENRRRLFIGSHSHKFFCIDATSGEIEWETTVGGRIESTAAVTSDFSQIVVGCYDGCIYFFDPNKGDILWKFQTGDEVKCQPAVDTWQGMIWCGSHDHHVYVLDSVSRTCIWKYLCDGSVFASPAIDAKTKQVYIATTNGKLYLIHAVPSYGVTWEQVLDAPIFASPNFNSSTGQVIVASVDGCVTAFSTTGSIMWKVKAGGPVFSSVCNSSVIHEQVLVTAQDGHLYSYSQVSGKLLWQVSFGGPIVAGAWVDETIQLSGKGYDYSLVCVCTTSGMVNVLKIGDLHSKVVATIQLPGDVFSTPMMIGGHIFVGCRDNNLYCLYLCV